jgi:hypothetical protein
MCGRLYYPPVSDVWPPPEARARAALWAGERHLVAGEYLAAADALDDGVACGDASTAEVARGMRRLAVAGYRHQTGDAVRAERQLAQARTRLSPFLPTFDEVELDGLLGLVAAALHS